MPKSSRTNLSVRLAQDERDVLAVQRLRYQVFVEELKGDGPMVDHQNRLERDELDPHFDHLILVDETQAADSQNHVVGAYRLLQGDRRSAAGGFYTDREFDLTQLEASGRRLLELGRSCVHPDHRGGAGMLLLWNGLADYVLDHDIEILFGAASFHGTDPQACLHSLSYLHHEHLAPPDLRVSARAPGRMETNGLSAQAVDKTRALEGIPPLIKAYLRLGGYVSDGAFIDHAFNTIDVCLVMDTIGMSTRHRAFYLRKAGRVT